MVTSQDIGDDPHVRRPPGRGPLPTCTVWNDRSGVWVGWRPGRRVRLSRVLTAAGVRSVVAAPPTLQRPSGDRVQTNAKDDILLARLLRLDRDA